MRFTQGSSSLRASMHPRRLPARCRGGGAHDAGGHCRAQAAPARGNLQGHVLLRACRCMTVAGAVAHFYFAKGDGVRMPRAPIWRAFWVTAVYHLVMLRALQLSA